MKTKLLLLLFLCTTAVSAFAIPPAGCSNSSTQPTPGSNDGTITVNYPAAAATITLRSGNGNGGPILQVVNVGPGAGSYTFTGLAGGYYHFQVNNAGGQNAGGGCGSNVQLIQPPCNATAVITPGGPTSFCSGGSVTLSANTGNSLSYLWSPGGATTSSITVSAGGSYTVRVNKGNNGQCYAISDPVVVTIYPNPDASVSANGPTTFCDGGSVTLSAPAGNSYLWSNGATSSSISVSTSGDYSVVVTNQYGCSAASGITTVTVNVNSAQTDPTFSLDTDPSFWSTIFS